MAVDDQASDPRDDAGAERKLPQSSNVCTDAIAVIGMSCRLPGGVSSSDDLWRLLCAGTSTFGSVPSSRFNIHAFYHPANPYAGTTNTPGGHFLTEDVAAFDAPFFGIGPVEAAAIDPQQRLMLEVAYEAFDNAGLSLRRLRGSKTGVYVGQWSSDYAEVLSRDVDYPALYQTTGIGPAITSNRISYFFDLSGPSFTVDTGCSASLVALHSAVQSLRSRETEMSFVGGVNLLLDPQRFTYQSKLKMFSPDGKSFSFDARANGYGRGEGCCGVVLKPLEAALRDGDHVRAIIRNSVVNQDGRTPGISVPSAVAQEAAIRTAYSNAKLTSGPDYVEAHGTGTAVGDPIEIQAIASAFSRLTNPAGGDLLFGSIKGNIGHTESAAGLAGFIKAVLMLENQGVPPQVNFEKANPKILLEACKLQIPRVYQPRELHRISVNSFGYGGTNAHVVVDRANDGDVCTKRCASTMKIDQPRHRPRAFVLSGAKEKSYRAVVERLISYLDENRSSVTSAEWFDRLAFSVCKRSVHNQSLVLLAHNSDDLAGRLAEALLAVPASRIAFKRPRVAYVFTGQGAQYYNMGRELLDTWPPFAASLNRSNKCLRLMGCSWDMMAELRRDSASSCLDKPALGQPVLTALQLALVDTLYSLGVKPSRVAGHSSGEIAAAYAAGGLTFEEAMTVSYHRGRLVQGMIDRDDERSGAMLVVGGSPETVEGYIQNLGAEAGKVEIACYNSPSNNTVSGDAAVIQQLARTLGSEAVFNRVLRTQGAAYHSQYMRQIEQEYRDSLRDVQGRRASIPMSSSSTFPTNDAVNFCKEYWVNNLVSPVRFTDAMRRLCQDQNDACQIEIVVEIGPHPQLRSPFKQTAETLSRDCRDIVYLPCLKRNTNAEQALLSCLGELFAQGIDVDLHTANCGFDAKWPRLLPDFPSYPFDQDRSYWHESRLSTDYRYRQFLPHELLGTLSPDVNHLEPRWRRYIRLAEAPWLQSHRVEGQVVFPAAGYLAMAIEAARQAKLMQDPLAEIQHYSLRNVSFGRALVLSKDSVDRQISLSLRPEACSARDSWRRWMEFRIFTSASDQASSEHCRGSIMVSCQSSDEMPDEQSFGILVDNEQKKRAEQASRHECSPDKFYFVSRKLGLDWAPPFNNLVGLRISPDTCVAITKTPCLDAAIHPASETRYVMHPGLLDATLFHGICSIFFLERQVTSAIVPTFIETLDIAANLMHIPDGTFSTYATSRDGGQTFEATAFQMVTDGERPVLSATGLVTTKLSRGLVQHRPRQICHRDAWVTYCQAMTSPWLHTMCGSGLKPASLVERNGALNSLTFHYTRQALDQVSADQVALGYQRHYYRALQALLDTAGPAQSSLILADSIDLGVAGKAVRQIGSALVGILTGTVETISIMVEDDLLSKLYSDDRNERCYHQIKAFCAELGRQNPDMRVLEIGGGTGSAAFPVLQACQLDGASLMSRYDFTDISSGFFEATAALLSPFADIVDHKVLNIEEQPSSQGFEEASYDLVIACNVLHATRDVSASLANAKALLKPGGMLVLMEITEEQPYYSFVFGAFSGWWAGVEEGRQSSPLLSPSQWTDQLAAAGFEQVQPAFRDFDAADGGTISVFLAKVPERQHAWQRLPVNIVVQPDRSQWSKSEIDHIARSTLTERNVAVRSLQDDFASPGSIVIYMPEVSESLSRSVDQTSWERMQQQLCDCEAALFLMKGGTRDVTNPDQGLATGLARCLRLEKPKGRYVTLDLAENTVDFQTVATLLSVILLSSTLDLSCASTDVDCDFAAHDGQLFVKRVIHDADLDQYIKQAIGDLDPSLSTFLDPGRDLKVELGVPGLFESFRWTDDASISSSLGPDDVRLELCAASINFRDVLIASGQVEGLGELKNDCSGTIVDVGQNMASCFTKGDRVCSFYAQSYNNYPVVHGDSCVIIPQSMSFEVAASLPVAWSTAYYSLFDVSRLQRGESVLIHSGTGAVGQAAIALAQYIGAEVYATAGSSAKRTLLVEQFGIPEEHIFSSRNVAFKRGILKATGGKGVDVVLNSLTGEMFRASCDALAAFGRFVEIGKKDFLDNALMPTKFLLRNITFACVDLTLLIDQEGPRIRSCLQKVVQLIASKAVKPTTITTMPITEIEAAFRLISSGRHVGKVILTVAPDQMVKTTLPPPEGAKLHADALYVIVGGLGGLGRSIVSWMADRGARKILIISRSGVSSRKANIFIEEIQERGVCVAVKQCDVASVEQLSLAINEASRQQGGVSVRGMIHSAMSLHDSLFENMTYSQWQRSLDAKVAGTWNLHNILGADLDFFILLSSVVSVAGHAGQSNYAAACAFQDSFAHYRRRLGRVATSINIGPVVDAGFVSDNPQVAAAMEREGFGEVTIAELLAHINYTISHPTGAVSSACQASIGLTPAYGDGKLSESQWANHRMHQHVLRADRKISRVRTRDEGGSKSCDYAGAIADSTTFEDVADLVCQAILEQLSRLVALPVENLSPARTLDDYGVDSLIAVELRNWIGAYLLADVPLLMVREAKSIRDLSIGVAKECRLSALTTEA